MVSLFETRILMADATAARKAADTHAPAPKAVKDTTINRSQTRPQSCILLRPGDDADILSRFSKPLPSPTSSSTAKLSKPPQLPRTRKPPTGNRLQRRRKSLLKRTPLPTFFVVQYESYPYAIDGSAILGVFSSIDGASLAATMYGAFAFSREGLHDGMEYLTPTGRIKIVLQDMQSPPPRRRSLVPEDLGFASNAMDKIIALRNFTQSDARSERRAERDRDRLTYVAVYKTTDGMALLGMFGDKAKAWSACLQHYAAVAYSSEVLDEMRWMDESSMPHIRAKVAGDGRQFWSVEAFKINEVIRMPYETQRMDTVREV